jgi:uncharacterized protein YecE (DUF72 family)
MRRSTKIAPLHIGTAGWGVPSEHAEAFPVEGSHLQRYAQRLSAVEINSSFHRLHRRAVYERWAASTPPDFRFAVKVPKTMTHENALADCATLIDLFAEQIAGLGDKLAVLLIQLPPSAALKRRTADTFFRRLRKTIDVPLVLEPRHLSWFEPKVDAWLAERRIARVAADPIPKRVPRESGADAPGGWNGLSYYRWHGSPRIYFSDYSTERLEALRKRVAEERRAGRAVWCMFDNTAGGHAIGNALWLSDKTARTP